MNKKEFIHIRDDYNVTHAEVDKAWKEIQKERKVEPKKEKTILISESSFYSHLAAVQHDKVSFAMQSSLP